MTGNQEMSQVSSDTGRSITFLNAMGDIEITWDPENDDAMRQVIEKKMAEGVSFFIMESMLFGLVKRRKQITDYAEVEGRIRIGDEDLSAMFEAGKIAVFRNDRGSEIKTAARAETPQQVMRSHTVAVRQFSGG